MQYFLYSKQKGYKSLFLHPKSRSALSSTSEDLGEILALQLELLSKRLASFDQALLRVRGVIAGLMAETKFSIGLEFGPNKSALEEYPGLYRLSRRLAPASRCGGSGQ
jgi:hypothetical protein